MALPSFMICTTSIKEGLYSRCKDFRWKVCDVGRDLSPRQELCYFIAERIAVVVKKIVGLSSVAQKKSLGIGT